MNNQGPQRQSLSKSPLNYLGVLIAAIMAVLWCSGNSRSEEPMARLLYRALTKTTATPFSTALRDADQSYHQAQDVVNVERDLWENWDPAVRREVNTDTWRRLMMARDHGGHLQRARQSLQQALRLAHGPADLYRVRNMEVPIERDAGNQTAAFKAAQALGVLEPQEKNVLRILSPSTDPVLVHTSSLCLTGARNQAERSK
jgi:hypothetical protein